MSLAFWELGIHHPIIYNRSFRNRAIFETTLDGAKASGNNTFTIDQPANAPTAQYIMGAAGGAGSAFEVSGLVKIVLGPSTDTDNIGAVEELWIISAASNTITTVDNCVYDYADEDPITIYGAGCPDGWTFSSDSELWGLLYSYQGYDDIFGFNIPYKASGVQASMKAEYALEKLVGGIQYQLSLFYKRDTVGTGVILFEWYDNTSNLLTTRTLNHTPVEWFEDKVAVVVSANQTSNGLFRIQWPSSGDINSTGIDCINLQFGWHGQSGGKYTFTDMPSDIRVFPASRNRTNMLLSGYSIARPSPVKVLYDRKWVIRCRFDMVDSSTENLFQSLKAYEAWQDRGYLLSLRTYLPDLPPFLTGRMEITGVSNHLHDTGVKSFDFMFEEMV